MSIKSELAEVLTQLRALSTYPGLVTEFIDATEESLHDRVYLPSPAEASDAARNALSSWLSARAAGKQLAEKLQETERRLLLFMYWLVSTRFETAPDDICLEANNCLRKFLGKAREFSFAEARAEFLPALSRVAEHATPLTELELLVELDAILTPAEVKES